MSKAEGSRRGNQAGTEEHLPSGAWRSRVMIEGRRVSVTAPDRTQLRRKVRELLHGADRGIVPATEKLTLMALADRWLETVVRHASRPRTLEFYRGVLERYVLPELGAVRLERLQAAEVQRVYSRLLDRGLSPKTVRHAHRTLYTLLEQAVTWGLVPRNIARAASPPKVERRESEALSPEDVKRLLGSPSDR